MYWERTITIKFFRAEKGSQEALGFGTPQAIYKWQHGQDLSTIGNLVVLAALLVVKIDDILVIDMQTEMKIGA